MPRNQIVLSIVTGLLLLSGLNTRAATPEEMQRLDEAYPIGSTVVCRAQLEGDGKNLLPMEMVVRGKVINKQGKHASHDVSVMWLPHKVKSAALTIHYRMDVTDEGDGHSTVIDPSSLKVSMPENRASEETVAEGFRKRFASGAIHQPYGNIEITDFPSYISKNQGEAPLYCSKEA